MLDRQLAHAPQPSAFGIARGQQVTDGAIEHHRRHAHQARIRTGDLDEKPIVDPVVNRFDRTAWAGNSRRTSPRSEQPELSQPALQPRAGRVPVAVDEVVVDQAARLHEGIDRGRANEAEAFRLQRFRDLL